MQEADSQEGNKRGPIATTYTDTGGGNEGPRAEGREDPKALVQGYNGFGILSLIRALMFRGWLSCMLSFIGIVLLVGQWMGPVGFIAFKLTTDDIEFCEGNASVWAKCVMASVAMIYFTRLSLAALAHTQKPPPEFEAYLMPPWWELYRQLDLVVTSLLYDTLIFLANLFIVFQDRRVSDMIVDVLALEFFTMIDDGFKAAVIGYDSTFLYDAIKAKATPNEVLGLRPVDAGGEYTKRSSSWMSPSMIESPLTAKLFSPDGVSQTSGGQEEEVSQTVEDTRTCSGGGVEALCLPVEVTLLVIRTICRLGGPLCAFVVIFYGPLCLGKATSTY